MVFQRAKPRSSKSKSHELRIPAFEALNAEELTTRSRLIEQVGNAFYILGMALAQLKEERLYRNTHLSFDGILPRYIRLQQRLCLSQNRSSQILSKFTRLRLP